MTRPDFLTTMQKMKVSPSEYSLPDTIGFRGETVLVSDKGPWGWKVTFVERGIESLESNERFDNEGDALEFMVKWFQIKR